MKKYAVLILLVLTGCKIEPPKQPLVQTIAILPFDNSTNDLNAADIMQKLTYFALRQSAYQVEDVDAINKKLADVGIVDGGQLPALDPVKMAKDFGVQALLYGSVDSFDYTNVGFFVQRKVSLTLKLVDGTTGETLWENSASGATRQINLDSKEAQNAFTAGLADQLIDKMFKTPLEQEARLATINTLRSLPGFTFTGFAASMRDASGAKSSSKDFLKGFIK